MADLKELSVKRAALLYFDPRTLKVKPGLNVRDLTTPDNRAHVEWLAESIAESGVRTPLEIFSAGDDVFVANGHCRLAATMLAIERGATIATVPCIPEGRGKNDIDRILDQFTLNSGKTLTALEQGSNVKRLLGYGLSPTDVAKRLSKSPSWVNGMLDLQEAPPEAQQAVSAGEISATLATQIVREEGPVKGTETIKRAVSTAKASGKKKATARHVERSRPARSSRNPATMFEAIRAAIVVIDGEIAAGIIPATGAFRNLRDLLAISIGA